MTQQKPSQVQPVSLVSDFHTKAEVVLHLRLPLHHHARRAEYQMWVVAAAVWQPVLVQCSFLLFSEAWLEALSAKIPDCYFVFWL